jgi:hypothetical protein
VARPTKEREEISPMLAQKSALNEQKASTSGDEGKTEGRGDDGHEKRLPHVWVGVGVDRGLEVGDTNNQREVPWLFILLSNQPILRAGSSRFWREWSQQTKYGRTQPCKVSHWTNAPDCKVTHWK